MMVDMMSTDAVLFAKVLADETRQAIMKAICCQWLSVNDIVARFQVSQPTVSHHLAVLREAGLVKTRESGKQTFYTLDQERMDVCCGQLRIKFSTPPAETPPCC